MSTQADAASAPRAGISTVWLGRGLVLLGTVLLVLYPVLSDNLYYQNMIILSLVFAIAASGLSIITGLAGYVSLGQGAFIGLGGYTVGILATHHPDTSVWLWVPLAGVVAGSGRAGPRSGRAACPRAVVRDHHRGVPVPGPGGRDQLALADGRAPRA